MRGASSGEGNRCAGLLELCNEVLGGKRLILASNRGPVEYRITANGELETRRGAGGVVTSLSSLSQYVDLTWIASAMGEGDREAAERAKGRYPRYTSSELNLSLRFVVSPKEVYHKFYNIFSNPLLWFLQHYMWDSPHTPNVDSIIYDAWENGYVPVNEAFAEAVLAEAKRNGPPSLIMLHDYHLYLVAGYIRNQLPKAIIHHFTHIPWPTPSYWQLLPSAMRKDIFESLCATDIVGLQTKRDVHNFLYGCETFLEEAEVDYEQGKVMFKEHLTRVSPYPISIDVAELKEMADSPRVQRYKRKLLPYCGEQTIVRVDRVEPSKNIVRGFVAFDILLENYPKLVGKVKFLAFLVPSRTNIRQYRGYFKEIKQVVESINAKYGTEEWQPITIFYRNNYAQAIAAMCLYDVLLVNPVIDGMNLVAKEGPTANLRNGVLVLSETAGASEQLGEEALTISPADVEATMKALHKALLMPAREKKRRSFALKKTIEREDITQWLTWQLQDLKALIQG